MSLLMHGHDNEQDKDSGEVIRSKVNVLLVRRDTRTETGDLLGKRFDLSGCRVISCMRTL